MLGAGEGNPTGHWEPLDALDLNEAFLERYGSNWYDPRSPSWETVVDSSERQAFVDQLAMFLERHLDEPAVLVIKEPRITALTEF